MTKKVESVNNDKVTKQANRVRDANSDNINNLNTMTVSSRRSSFYKSPSNVLSERVKVIESQKNP